MSSFSFWASDPAICCKKIYEFSLLFLKSFSVHLLIFIKLELTLSYQSFNLQIKVLKENIERVKARRNNDASTIQEMLDIQEDFLVIRAELILLQSYSSLNFVGEHMN